MFEFITLYAGYLKNSKKIIFVSIIGLTCALALISSSLLYIDASKAEISNSIIKSTGQNRPYDISLDYSINYPYINTTTFTQDVTQYATNISDNLNVNIFSRLDMTYLVSNFYTPQKSSPKDISQPLVNNSVTIIELNDALRKDLIDFLSNDSLLPVTGNSIQQAFALQSSLILTTDPLINFYRNTDLINKSLINIFLGSGQHAQSFQFNITGVSKLVTPYTFNTQSNSYTLGNKLTKYPTLSRLILNDRPIETFLFVNNLTRFVSTIQLDKQNLPYFSAFGGFKIDFNKIDVLSIPSRTTDIKNFQTALQNRIVNSQYFQNLKIFYPVIKVTFQTSANYDTISTTINTILFYIFLYSFPILIIALFMATYSFGLIFKKQLLNINIYRTRGLPRIEIFKILILDLLIVTGLAFFFSLLLGFPIASLASKTDFLLSFNNSKNINIITAFLNNIVSIVTILFFSTIVFSVLVNFVKIYKLTNMSIAETENPTDLSEPFWKRFYLDVVFFLYGLVTYGILIYLLTNPQYAQNLSPAIFIFLNLATPSPFVLGLGFILLVNRFIPIVMNFIGAKLWITKGDLLAFSFKDIIKYSHTSTRAIILIAALLSFVLLFYTIPYSQIHYEQQVSLFENGAEGVIHINNFENNLTNIHEIINKVSFVLTNYFSTSIEAYSPFFTELMYDNGISNQQFIFINASSYMQASIIDQVHTGLKNSLSKDLSTLQKINNSILINSKASNKLGISINEKLYVPIKELQTQEFPVIDIFNTWPATTRYTWDRNLYAIIDMNAFLNSPNNSFINTSFSQISNFGFYLNFKQGVNKTAVAEKINKFLDLPVQVSNYNPSDWSVSDALILQFQISQLNINLLISIVMILVVLILFSYMQLYEKKNELMTLRALGANFIQISSIFLLELAILITSGLILGTLLGIVLVNLLSVFMTQGKQIPAYEVIIPWSLVLETYIIFIAITVIDALLTGYFIVKKEISDSLIYL